MVELERFRLEGSRLWVTCPKCAAEHAAADGQAGAASAAALGGGPGGGGAKVSLVSSPQASNVVTLRTAATEAVQLAAKSVSDPVAVPKGRCPKCLAKRTDGTACPHCGLLFERFDPRTVEPPPWLLEAWNALLGDWGNQLRHERLRADASQRGALSQLGRLYRLRLAWFPDDPWAETGRAEIVRMAEVSVAAGLANAEVANSDLSAPRGKAVAIIALIAFLFAAGLLGYLLLKTS